MQEAMNARAIEELYVDDYMFVSFPNKFMCKEKPDEWIKYTQGLLSGIRRVNPDFKRFGYNAFVNVSPMKTEFEINVRLQII